MTDKKVIVKKKLVTFRIDIGTDNKLNAVADHKKMNRTEVITDLIRLAHIGIFSDEAKKLNTYFKNMIFRENKTKGKKTLKKNL